MAVQSIDIILSLFSQRTCSPDRRHVPYTRSEAVDFMVVSQIENNKLQCCCLNVTVRGALQNHKTKTNLLSRITPMPMLMLIM